MSQRTSRATPNLQRERERRNQTSSAGQNTHKVGTEARETERPNKESIQNLTDNKPRSQWTRREKEKFIKENLPLRKMKLIQDQPDIQTRLVDMLVENFSCLSLHENDYGETGV